MAKFINLTERRSGTVFTLNIDAIEYMRPAANGEGTEIVTTTHHTKYLVQEIIGHICEAMVNAGVAIIDAMDVPEPTEEDLA